MNGSGHIRKDDKNSTKIGFYIVYYGFDLGVTCGGQASPGEEGHYGGAGLSAAAPPAAKPATSCGEAAPVASASAVPGPTVVAAPAVTPPVSRISLTSSASSVPAAVETAVSPVVAP